jgi:hypothetical protein
MHRARVPLHLASAGCSGLCRRRFIAATEENPEAEGNDDHNDRRPAAGKALKE